MRSAAAIHRMLVDRGARQWPNGKMEILSSGPLLRVVGACRRIWRIGSRAASICGYQLSMHARIRTYPNARHYLPNIGCQFRSYDQYNGFASNIGRNGSNKSRAHHSIRKTPKILDIPLNIQHVFLCSGVQFKSSERSGGRRTRGMCQRVLFSFRLMHAVGHMAVLSFAHCHGTVNNTADTCTDIIGIELNCTKLLERSSQCTHTEIRLAQHKRDRNKTLLWALCMDK